MATPTPARRARRALTGLLVFAAVLAGANALGTFVFKESSFLPELALDLQGGTQIVLEAQTGGETPSKEQMLQAVAIMRERVDAAGVSEAEVTTQGSNNIVVQIPGEADEATRERISAAAQLQLRKVIYASDAANTYIGDDDVETPYPSPTEGQYNSTPTASPTSGNDTNWVTDELYAEFLAYDCTDPDNALAADQDTSQPLIACDPDNTAKYILGPLEMDGSSIDDAQAVVNQSTGAWAVSLDFDDEGTETFAQISQELYGQTEPQNMFAFVLDGVVISAPTMDAVITDGKPQISGTGITQDTASTLADQLKFGALPISFDVVSSDTISSTLGSQQLKIGLITGIIGLGLVALYVVFISYRSLGFVIIASLGVMAVLTYIALCLLSWRIGYRLSLAGVAGLIVTIGFTADSFIVYFERIRDELRDGKGVTIAVEDGWDRAKRTIFISKSINILAAVVLYILADSTVKGFAFTLGLTTLLDVLIFVVFTHPVMQLLVRTHFFGGGHPLSGLDPESLGAVYRGRARFLAPEVQTGRVQRSRGEAAKRQTIAERKEAERRAAESTTSGKKEDA
ncbi:MAG: protein translocase subunit SecD [Microbacterium sp.]